MLLPSQEAKLKREKDLSNLKMYLLRPAQLGQAHSC